MKSIYYVILCCLLSSIVLCSIQETAAAQSKEHELRPRKRGNQNKIWQFESYTVVESEYSIDGYFIRVVALTKQDSVYLYSMENGKKLVSSFLADKDGRISNPLSLEYVTDRSPYIDSIVPGMSGKSKQYFNRLLYTDAVRLTTDPHTGLKHYYDSKGKDSLYFLYTADDSVLIKNWFRDGKDSLQRRWNAQGKLIYEESGRVTQRWNDEQQLIEKTFDTLIQNSTVECIKSWYPSGVLASIRYYYFDEACLNWEYYNEKGKLVRLDKKKKLNEITPVVHAIEPPSIYTTVAQKEEVAPLFDGELNRKLSALLQQTKGKPAETYKVLVWLEPSGKFTLNKLDGEYADVIGPDIETIFNELSGARPAKRNGKPYAQLLELTLKVIRQEKP